MALGTPSSQAETIGQDIGAAKLFYSLAAASRDAATYPGHSERARKRPNGAVDVTTKVDGASLRQMKPLAYQEVGAERTVVPSWFKPMGDHRFGFRVSSYDGSSPLVIDPVLDFSTYVGGARFDRGEGIAVDGQGNIYVTG